MIDLSSFARDGIALVFGASGGVGLALCQEIEASGQFTKLVALSRRSIPAFDLTEEESIRAAVDYAAAQGPLRLVIDATGFLHDEKQGPEKSLRDLDAHKLARNFALNAIGPALIMKYVLPLLPAQGKSVFATLSARVGSIGDNHLGGWYGYRASKAALNQLMHTAAIETRRRRSEAICVSLHPGTVQSDLSSPFAKEGLEVQTPQQSARSLLAVMNGLEPAQTGLFFDHHGKPIVW